MSAAKYLASKVDHEAEGLELHAERDEALTALAESRARFADSEARRAELEAVIRRVDGLLSHAADQSDPYVSTSREALNASPSVVLEDRDREVRAKEREKIAADIDDGVVEWDDLRQSDDGFHWAEQCVATAWDSSGVWTGWLRRTAAAIRKGETNA